MPPSPPPGAQALRQEGGLGDVVVVMAGMAARPRFDEVRQLYGAAVHRFCLVVLGDGDAAESAANRALEAAQAAYPVDNPEPSTVPVWLLGIACEVAGNVRRRRRASRRGSTSTELDAALSAAAALPDQELFAAALRGAAGLGYAEIGSLLGTSPEAARMACGWAMRRIRTGVGRIG
ncbi:MAG: polymerase sigma factor, sigma-70 family [Chloroflexi bacterium]|jgi:DNA-directed RNA polymerase specialized sigma24 family protein|nr:polymerase sigma factor, sigma-70 family [Chloroflexota bacterium]